MGTIKLNSIMRDEIKFRMESKSWDFNIAVKVIEKKKKTKKILILSSTFSSLAAAAAALMIIFLFGISELPENANYSAFVSQQINGTYNNVFKEVKFESDKKNLVNFVTEQIQGTYSKALSSKIVALNRSTKEVDNIFASDIDSIIDGRIALR